jgi:diguanylate cyclase (GGDEF)-like protein
VVGADGEVIRVIGTLADVTETRVAEERMLHDAVHDNLTGLPNREIFFDRLETAIAHAQFDREARPTVIAIDIDRFRDVNEAIGIPGGDSILLTIARRLLRLMQLQDTLARISSDEFAMIIRSERDPQSLIAIAEAVRKSVLTPIVFNDREIAVTASIGIALFDSQLHAKREDMLKDAMVATAHAKKSGGNRVEFFRPGMRTQHSDRLSLEADLRRAIDRQEIKVAFRPVVRLEDRTIAGFEALLRWDHPRFGRLSPVDFIPIAEETGLILDLTLFALERTARELAAWQRAIDVTPPIFASVNVSSRQLLRHELLHDVKGVITRSGVQKNSLKLEMSETLVMENPEYSAQILQRVREVGAGLILDDFGSGYSSLAYLQRLPFDMIRIGRSFVRHDATGMRPTILRSLVALARDLGMEVIAEGAESESDTIELYQIGCEVAQGYAFGRPITAGDARKLVGAAPDTGETRAVAE